MIMARKMIILSVIVTALFCLFIALYYYFLHPALLTLTITFFTFSYHLTMRLAVGYTLNAIINNKVNYNKKIFQEMPFEKKFFKLIKMHKLKKHAPTFNPKYFDIKNGLESVIMASCQAEIIHTVIFFLSYLPIVFCIFWNSFWAFFITSVISSFIDLYFILLQRYNRPRLIKALQRQKKQA